MYGNIPDKENCHRLDKERLAKLNKEDTKQIQLYRELNKNKAFFCWFDHTAEEITSSVLSQAFHVFCHLRYNSDPCKADTGVSDALIVSSVTNKHTRLHFI